MRAFQDAQDLIKPLSIDSGRSYDFRIKCVVSSLKPSNPHQVSQSNWSS
jgi:hypothetical protein